MELIFATHNQHKTNEARAIIGDSFFIKNLKELGCFTEIPETADTLSGNALQKAKFVQENYGLNCFADDTGLEIEVLGNKPGVFSARYAGEHCSFQDNVDKVLKNMEGLSNRKACFKTVIALILDNQEYLFEGRINGKITEGTRGITRFGYDPIFIPDGYDSTFAELGDEIKNHISHRGIAMRKLMDFLTKTLY